MSDGVLSQKEIDALLGDSLSIPDEDDYDLDGISGMLTTMVNVWASNFIDSEETGPDIEHGPLVVDRFEDMSQQIGQAAFVEVELHGEGVSGVCFFLFPSESIIEIAGKTIEPEAITSNITPLMLEALSNTLEATRSEMGSALATHVGTDVTVEFTAPALIDLNSDQPDDQILPLGEEVIQGSYRIKFGGKSIEMFAQIPRSVTVTTRAPSMDEVDPSTFGTPESFTTSPLETAKSSGMDDSKASVQEAHFAELGSATTEDSKTNLDLLLDVPLQVTVELGRTRMQIREVLDLGKGSVVELDKLAGEPVEVFINGKLIAKGEVVTIDENFGVKITDVVSKVERVNNLQ